MENIWKDKLSHISGLTDQQVAKNQHLYGLNVLAKKKYNFFSIFVRQLTNNPLLLILATATALSYFLGQHASSYYIFCIILFSILLGVWNEYSAEKTIDNLLKHITPNAIVIRNNEKKEIPVSHITIGDVVLVSQGSIIPADMQLLDDTSLELDESSLTGESRTVHKTVQEKTNESRLFMGTSVRSGSGKGVVTAIGSQTAFGKIAKTTTYLKPVTEFQKGLAGFGSLIIKIIFLLTIAIFLINTFLGHHILNSLLFALAIAVGLTPELLPVIVTVSLSYGAGKLAKKHVIAKRLLSIENLGNMDILCTDKTGTLTEGEITVVDFIDSHGEQNTHVLNLALLCNEAIIHHKVLGNAIDTSLWNYALKHSLHPDRKITKIHEEPFDYNRKAMFSVVHDGTKNILIAKGAPDTIFSYCHSLKEKAALHKKLGTLNQDGFRVIMIATKPIKKKEAFHWDDVSGLSFEGYITFLDIPKSSTKEALQRLQTLHVEMKVITGDNELVAKHICEEVGMKIEKIITGHEIDKLSHDELARIIPTTTLYARVNPEQKLRVIQTLQSLGHTVGYLGDGINDIPSLHSADVGISVNTAIDVAKDAASVVLLRKNLHVIADGIVEGRKTFSNTIKYILMSTSSNFGNMFSAAGASFLLPFLPMSPVQILLTNGLYDISQLTIPSDNVDEESLVKPRHWDITFIKSYMLFFGPLSSLFDFLTFGLMFFVFHARGMLFQTGWFIESIATEILVVFVIRTSRFPFFLSRPSGWLAATSLGIVALGFLLPFTPLAKPLGFVTPPPLYFFFLTILVLLYLLLVESVKNIFLRKYHL